MARFLILTFPLAGHVSPAKPIAQKMVERGHEVLWITGCIFKDEVEAVGAQHLSLPKEIDPGDKGLYEFYPQVKELQGLAQVKWYVKHVFFGSAVPMIKAIENALEGFQADVLIGNTITPGVFMASELSGIPSALLSDTPLSILSRDTAPGGIGMLPGTTIVTKARDRLLNFLVARVLLRDIERHVSRLRQSLGLKPYRKPVFREAYEAPTLILQLCTPSFEYPRSDLPDTFHFIGPVVPSSDPNYRLPEWWSDLNGSQPVVLINQGTVADNLDDVIVPAIQGLKAEEMLVVAVPVRDGDLGTIPANVRTEPFIPFGNLLPHVDVMVTNGGYGATQMALAHGVPLVIAGATEDKMEVAARVEWSGCGINLRKKSPSSQDILGAVKDVLANGTYRDNAERLRAEIMRYDAPTKAVELLEGLVDG